MVEGVGRVGREDVGGVGVAGVVAVVELLHFVPEPVEVDPGGGGHLARQARLHGTLEAPGLEGQRSGGVDASKHAELCVDV